ncbi:hypothetical protein HK100_002384 [Physocladia obscura]|uniref:Protein MAK16 n=1 Tax=Physocladia obscura TaxID=109957 RepID=A0AAD5SVU6_9FUNG|nr:hypothetical protein HK100_002384 [Physocladia obscura]
MAQVDEVIWKVINNQFCSYKVKIETNVFCRNEYSVTGLCNRQSCPLANSRYATIKEEQGQLYLYMKTIERAHTPAKLWEKIKLSKNYAQALEQIDTELQHWPKFVIHKCKQRATKLTQYIIRTRRLIIKGSNKKTETINKKVERRESRREAKAESAARLEISIEKELMERLRKGVYNNGEGMVNLNQSVFEKALDRIEDEIEDDLEEQIDDDDEEGDYEFEEEDEKDVDILTREFVSDPSDDETDDDIEDSAQGISTKKSLGLIAKRKRTSLTTNYDADSDDEEKNVQKKLSIKKPKARVNVEYEEELEGPIASTHVSK